MKWGHVDFHYFADAVGYGSVPNKGLHPLGLGIEIEESRSHESVDEVEEIRQASYKYQMEQKIHQEAIDAEKAAAAPSSSRSRSNSMTQDTKRNASSDGNITGRRRSLSVGNDGKGEDVADTIVYETRQWDYKPSGATNPLFSSLPEEERIIRLLALQKASNSTAAATTSIGASPPQSPSRGGSTGCQSTTSDKETVSSTLINNHHTNHTNSKKNKKKSNSRSRSNSTTDDIGHAINATTDTSRNRSYSSVSVGDENDDDKTLAFLHKEIRAIKNARSLVTKGCSCRPIKVDKLSVSGLKKEVMNLFTATSRSRSSTMVLDTEVGDGNTTDGNVECVKVTDATCSSDTQIYTQDDLDNMSKNELTTLLKTKLLTCALCRDNNCECVADGVGCRGDTCECLRRVTKGKKNDDNNINHKSCDNPYGQLLFDSDNVKEYRRTILNALANSQSSN